jgi:hypothetical protein
MGDGWDFFSTLFILNDKWCNGYFMSLANKGSLY